jgi:hypothetical protein
MVTFADAALLIDATTMTAIEDAASLYSDMYKEAHGFRPRDFMSWDAIIADPQGALALLNARNDRLSVDTALIIQEERALEARASVERAAFALKLTGLGLDPAKYMELAD